MQKLLLISSLLIGVVYALLFPVQWPPDAGIATNGNGAEQEVTMNTVIGPQVQTTSCVAPSITGVERCQQLEAAILATTLRLEITLKTLHSHGSGSPTRVSVGHATVVDGRFLVTHNHFAQSPDEQQERKLLTLSAYRADGSLAIHQAPPHTFQVFMAGPQTLVFDFGQYGGQGAFDYMGMASAQLGAWQALGLRPGTEVGQVNWDGKKSHVDWVQVSSVGLENGIPVLQLDNYAEPGASGGGVFYAGHHVGNNWYRNAARLFITGKTLREWTVAALNDTNLIALTTGDTEPALTKAAPLPNGGSLLNLATADAVVR
ncbi:MAG TPA: hypothetical protein VK879_16480 [Candidatus Sulfomarinibacteraceae bacterium]|nr:hypothetical protein [Candidatus Sulfomarinibacteraceae bacterium]